MDFPRAWQLAQASNDAEHDPRCSWIVGQHGLLCDCPVITEHPEYHQPTTVDGKPWPNATDAPAGTGSTASGGQA